MESPIAAASVSMWAASERSASESATNPAATSPAIRPRISASAIQSLPRSASALTPWEWPWWEWDMLVP